jgi:PAS domain S-box-containing protein
MNDASKVSQLTDQDRTQDRLSLLLESTGEGIFGIDLDGLCTFINSAGARMLGFAADQVLGRNMHELTHHSHRDGSHYPVDTCPIFNAFRQGLGCRIDTEVFWRGNGESFSVEYSSYPILKQQTVLGAVITFVDITERRNAEAELKRAKLELEDRVNERTAELTDALRRLQDLSAHSHTVVEQERTRIAREIHDELGSMLVALKMDVNWLAKRIAAPIQSNVDAGVDEKAVDAKSDEAVRIQMSCKCEAMSNLIESAVDNVGRIITDLRPSILDHQGLWAALEWQVSEFGRTFEVTSRFETSWLLEAAPPEPDDAKAMAIFRIVQEALSNVGRHSLATRVDVHLELREIDKQQQLIVEIADDGKGADVNQLWAANSYGMIGMRERSRHFGGDLQVQTSKALGCRILLTMPL